LIKIEWVTVVVEGWEGDGVGPWALATAMATVSMAGRSFLLEPWILLPQLDALVPN